jgi:hypothetical protein
MKLLLTATALMLALIGYSYFDHSHTEVASIASTPSNPTLLPLTQPDPDASLSQDIDKLKSTVNPLRDQVQQIQSRLDGITASNETAATASTESAPEPNDLEMSQKEEQRQYFATIENNMSFEDENQTLSEDLSQQLDIDNNPIPGVDVTSVHCGGSICKLDISLNGDEGMENLQGDFRDRLSETFKAGAINHDELGRTIVYVATDVSAFDPRDTN